MKYYVVLSVCIAMMALWIDSADAVGCYVCKDVDYGCGFAFNYVYGLGYIETGCHYCTKKEWNLAGTWKVERNCANDSLIETRCIDASLGSWEGHQCSCDRELCNAAPALHTSLSFAFALAVAVAAFSRFLRA